MLKNATVHQVRIDSIKPYQNNAKIHGPDQIRKIADGIIRRWEEETGKEAIRL